MNIVVSGIAFPILGIFCNFWKNEFRYFSFLVNVKTNPIIKSDKNKIENDSYERWKINVIDITKVIEIRSKKLYR